jgi:leader peptidase (prepilin peptidase)/N-methyltransferase
MVELITGLLTLFVLARFGITPTGGVLLLLTMALVVITFIDLEHQIIPDVISLPGIVLGFLFSFFIPWLGWKNSLMGILLGGGVLLIVAYGYYFLTGKEGMGGGDIKLLAMLGAFLGWRSVPFIIFAASLVGSVIGISVMLARRKDGRLAIPFGPFLAFAAIIYIFYGKSIIQWYFSLGRGAGG